MLLPPFALSRLHNHPVNPERRYHQVSDPSGLTPFKKRERERERERERFIRNNLHNGAVSGAAEKACE